MNWNLLKPDALEEKPKVDREISNQDDLIEILGMIGHEHRKWLSELWRVFKIKQEPITTKTGEVVAEPIFWFSSPQSGSFACFGLAKPSQRIAARLEDVGVRLLEVGEKVLE